MGLQPKALLRLLLPGLFLGAAFWGSGLLGKLTGEQLRLLGYLPYLLAVVSLVLAYQFNRSRFSLLAILTAGTFWLIQRYLQVPLTEPEANATYSALSVVMPMALLFLLLVPERGVWNRYGMIYALVVAVMVAAAPRILQLVRLLLDDNSDWLQIWPSEILVVSPLASALFAGVAAAGLLALCWRDDDTEVALLITLGAGYLVLGFFHRDFISLSLFNVAGIVQLMSILRSSHAMAYRDDLTGLLGRRALNERLKGLGPRYSVAMLDVDHFKKFNDTYGHDVGDDVLKMVASQVARIGAGGAPFRYGGEEFCILFPRRFADECVEALEELRVSIADYHMTLRDKGQRPVRAKEGERKRGRMATRIKTGTVAVTVSIGLAERDEGQLTPEEVIKAADRQLYRAKQAGRNRLCY